MNFKIRVILVCFLVLFTFTYFGCRKKEVSQEEAGTIGKSIYEENGLSKDTKVTIKAIYPVTGYGREYFDYAVKTFEERFTNVKINVRYLDGGTSYQNVMQSLIRSGNEEEMYDWIYSLPNNNLKEMIRTDKLEVQDDLWGRQLYDKPNLKVKDGTLADERAIFIDGHLYGFSHGTTVYGLFYNEKMFNENGWNKHPKDWKEFVQLCQQIKANGVYPMVMAGKYPYYFDYGWGAIPHEVGGDKYYEARYNYEPDLYKSKPMVTMLERMEEFAKKGYFHPGTVSFDHTQSQMEFLQGTAAMITNATWIANEMRDVTPEGFKWGFMAFPGNDLGQEKVLLVHDSTTGLIWRNKSDLVKKWAKEFNLWLVNLDVQLKFAQSGGMPTRKDFKEEHKELKGVSPSVISVFEYIDQEDVRLVNNGVRSRAINNAEMAKVGTLASNGYVAILNGTKSAAQVSKEVNSQYMKGLKAER